MSNYPTRSDHWEKVWCPSCNKPNWFYFGSDITRPDIHSGECYSCKDQWWFDETCQEIAELDEYTLDDSVKGKETPT